MADNPLAEQRQRQIDAMIQQLASEDPADRREAAYYLGEAAAGDAVSELIDLYENDEDRSVRRAAAYALGMFRAVEKELARGNQERVVRLLERVEVEGKLGKRADHAGLRSTIILLLFFLAILAGINYWLTLPESRDTFTAAGLIQPTQDQRPAQATSLLDAFERLRADATTLQTQFNSVRSGGSLDCTAFFNNIPPQIAANYPGLPEATIRDVISQMNGVNVDLVVAKTRYDAICNNPDAGIDLTQIEQVASSLSNAVERLNTLEPQVINVLQQFVPPTPTPTDTPLPPTPTNPLGIANVQEQLNRLYSLVDEMSSPRGTTSLLLQYWEDVANTGTTGGCSQRPPTIPEDYVLPPADEQAAPELRQAVDLINAGLQGTRTGWTDFIFSCNSRTLGGDYPAGLSNARASLESFRAATGYLDIVRDSGL